MPICPHCLDRMSCFKSVPVGIHPRQAASLKRQGLTAEAIAQQFIDDLNELRRDS